MILPGETLGVLGGGQLGRMFTQRAQAMGYQVAVFDPGPASPAGQLANHHFASDWNDTDALEKFAATVKGATIEFENVPTHVLEFLAERIVVRPGPAALASAQDRIVEKAFLADHGFPTAPWGRVTNRDELMGVLLDIGPPAILKTSRMGYDGKGQSIVDDPEGGLAAFRRFGERPCVLERRLELECELSVVLARGCDGEVACFPVGENVHRNGILDITTVPSSVSPVLRDEAVAVATAVAVALDYTGVLGVELFVAEGGQLFVNEIAPRPHNSGHYTLDACVTDQFEQQVRSLAGLSLGDARLMSPACMVNLLGDLWRVREPDWSRALAFPGIKLHLYGKGEARPGRKMGHLTCLAATPEEARSMAIAARDSLTAAHGNQPVTYSNSC